MTQPVTYHRTDSVAGLDIFYREAGERGAPAVVLLHGFPSSSHMYRNLIPALADRYHVIAPDLPGFGLSEMPSSSDFEYGFATFSTVVDSLLEQLGVERYALYVMDYGAPTGFRLALAHPDRVTALIIQNGNAYEDGMGDFWAPTRAYWADNGAANRDAMRPFLSLDGTRFQYLAGTSDEARIDPAVWLYDQLFLDRPGSVEIQLDIIYDYRTNIALYPAFHAYLREYRPPTLILWGENDPIFLPDGARAYLRDVPDAELHFLDTGHFALEEKADEMIPLMRDFLARNLTH
ncbi:pimeloyl-ACP methyl ester carboxylesterase [Rhizobium sp. BK529]|uniref:alpha/beta fold hydrolase n=1 Tax=unclassified Rhizobium TaxID=2613769 RepID=UPI00104EBB66|nr:MULTISPECIES: alpha/beta hydrolase [unclassified Rhizobium]MBB3595036.1 pimeloyl-ACP methyl ester carboxylesterase [Rhizobium sp. BK529]TCR98704.1 pimeloyl-ACP methyl ester carboxylesterase [Rhizobium sp. BK418]